MLRNQRLRRNVESEFRSVGSCDIPHIILDDKLFEMVARCRCRIWHLSIRVASSILIIDIDYGC
jgi:hypothetical protein